MRTPTSDYARVASAIEHLRTHRGNGTSLDDVARHVGLSPFHFQRMFQRWAGVSPKQFAQFLTLTEARRRLAVSQSVLATAFDVGLSAPSRLHDLFLRWERITPGSYRAGGAGLTISWAVAPTPLGSALFARVAQGLCGLAFLDEAGKAAARVELSRRWPNASFQHGPDELKAEVDAVNLRLAGGHSMPLSLVLRGTPFQLQVWEALLRIPEGLVVSYAGLADVVCTPKATRAVGAAVGANPLATLIPCHRVLRANGDFGEYRWGGTRKVALLAREWAKANAA